MSIQDEINWTRLKIVSVKATTRFEHQLFLKAMWILLFAVNRLIGWWYGGTTEITFHEMKILFFVGVLFLCFSMIMDIQFPQKFLGNYEQTLPTKKED